MSEANRDDARECLARAHRAKADGEVAKAKRLAEKAKALYPGPEVRVYANLCCVSAPERILRVQDTCTSTDCAFVLLRVD